MATRPSVVASIESSLQGLSVGSYLFQSRVAEELGLHPTDLQAIHILGREKELSAGVLGKALGLTSGATTALIDRLERLGYAERRPHADDRRRVVVTLCPERRGGLKAHYQEIDRRILEVAGRRSTGELQVVALFLAELVEGAADV